MCESIPGLYSISLIYLSALIPITYCLVALQQVLKSGNRSLPTLSLLKNCFGQSSSFVFLHKFQTHLVIFYRKACWNFDRDSLESIDQFEEKLHLKIQSLQSTNIVYSSIYLGLLNFLKQCFVVFNIKVLQTFARFIPKYFTYLDVIVNGICYFIF